MAVRYPWSGAVEAIKSVTSGPAPPNVIEARRAQCFAPCQYLERVGEEAYCGKCGCPRSRWSELGQKLTYGYVNCPLGLPGFSNAREESKPC